MQRPFAWTTALVVLLAWARAASAEPQETPGFARKPAATRSGDAVRIDFAVTRETDVAVYVENSKGEIVRHLAAGRLGKTPPEPFKAGSLEQSVTWDGMDDDGRPAAGAPFRVRVGLGLKASWGGLAFAETGRGGPNVVESVLGLAAGPEGRVYVMSYCGAWLYWNTTRIHVFRRDGSYEKTIKPFSPTLPPERIKAIGAFVNSFGSLNPIVYRPLGFSFYPHDDVGHQPAVTADGRLVLATRTADTHMYASGAVGVGHLAMIDAEGGIPEPEYAGPSLKAGWTPFPYLVSAPDGKALYFTGLGPQNNWGAAKPWHAVYRAGLPGRGPQEVFFGDPATSGNDPAHLNDPRGVAVDGKGQLFVADFGNNRVVLLKEADKSFVGSFDVPSPDWLAVHPKTGAVYVQSGDAVIKFSDGRQVARLALPPQKDARWRLTLDASAEPALLWAGCKATLVRSEDRGEAFGELVPAGCVAPRLLWRPAADPTRKLVACRIGGMWGSQLHILDEASGQVRVLGSDVAGSEGRTHRLGPDGAIYAVDHTAGIIRYDRDGKLNPFPATSNDPALRGRLGVGNTGTTAWERDFWVDRRSQIYVRRKGPEYHGHMTVEVYDPQGRLRRTALWTVSDAMYGPRVDAAGNMVIMDMIKPVGELYPKEFEGRLTSKRAPHWYNWIYGSVIKFGPEGGAIWFADNAASPLTYEGWGATASNSVSNLRTTGGSLRGDISKKPAEIAIPAGGLEAAVETRVVLRLKNDSDGSQAVLNYHVVGEPYGTAPRKKAIPIKPNSDFTEVAFDLAAEKDWKGIIHRMSLSPTNGAKGSFSIDWVQIPGGKSPLVWNFDREDSRETKLPATMKKEEVAAYTKPKENLLQGARWWRSGFSPLGKVQGNDTCHCTASDFDMDDFGRIFVPDNGRFRIGVLDSNGNELLSFGAYGNQDFCGPESYVVDRATKLLRPRKADDPKDLKSPFADPEIALGWVVGLAVTDRYAYVDDVLNKRMLRVRLDYAVSETVAAP